MRYLLFTILLGLVILPSAIGQVGAGAISRPGNAVPTPFELRAAPAPETWPSHLAKAWTDLAEAPNGAEMGLELLRPALAMELAGRVPWTQVAAVAATIESSERWITLARLAAAAKADPTSAKELFVAARGGLAFTDVAGTNRLLAALMGAAAAIGDEASVTEFRKRIKDPEMLLQGIGNALAEMPVPSAEPPTGSDLTTSLLDELLSSERKGAYVAGMYQAKAILTVAKAWRASASGFDDDRFTALCRLSAHTGNLDLLDMTPHQLDVIEALQQAGQPLAAAPLLQQADQSLRRRTSSAEYGAAETLRLHRLLGDPPDGSLPEQAEQSIQIQIGVLQIASRLLAAREYWKLGRTEDTFRHYRTALTDAISNPNPHILPAARAKIRLDCHRLGITVDDKRLVFLDQPIESAESAKQ